MTGKLNVVVGMDVDFALMRIEVRGMVTKVNVRALYALIRRANITLPGIDLIMDLSAAVVEPAALEQLRDCERSHRLPADVDPAQQNMQLKVMPEAGRGMDRTALGLAA